MTGPSATATRTQLPPGTDHPHRRGLHLPCLADIQAWPPVAFHSLVDPRTPTMEWTSDSSFETSFRFEPPSLGRWPKRAGSGLRDGTWASYITAALRRSKYPHHALSTFILSCIFSFFLLAGLVPYYFLVQPNSPVFSFNSYPPFLSSKCLSDQASLLLPFWPLLPMPT